MIKGNLSAGLNRMRGFIALIGKLLALQKIEDAVRRRRSRLQIGHALRDLRERRCEQANVQDKGYDHAKFDGSIHRQQRSHHAHRHIGDIADDVHQRLHHAGQELGTPVGIVHGGIQPIEPIAHAAFGTADAHDLMTGIHFFHIAVQFAQTLLPRGEVPLGSGHNQHQRRHAEERYAQRDQRQPPFGEKHHDQTADELRRRADDRGQAVGQSLLQGGYIVGDAA